MTEQDIYDKGDTIDFPQSVVEFFEGRLGFPYQGFPEKLQKIILKGKKPLTQRPGKTLEPVDLKRPARNSAMQAISLPMKISMHIASIRRYLPTTMTK